MIGNGHGGGSRVMEKEEDRALQKLARVLRSHGLATPALMLIDLLVPLAFVGEQALAMFAPLLPSAAWREGAHTLVSTLKDEHQRSVLQRLLED
jgi:hypothetical protein